MINRQKLHSPNIDCFACRKIGVKDNYTCSVLERKNCTGCSFYKTKEQFDTDAMNTYRKWAEIKLRLTPEELRQMKKFNEIMVEKY